MDKYLEIVQKTIKNKIPYNLDWELTYRCNLKCRHCYQTGPLEAEEISKEDIYKVLDDLAEMGCLFVTYSGGELFLRKDIFEILEYTRSKSFAFRLLTNGTLIDEHVADKLAKLKPLSIEISLYAMNPDVHDWMTQEAGSFDKSMKAIRLLRERDLNVKIKSTVIHENQDQIKALADFAKSIDAAFVYYLGAVPKVDGTREVCAYNVGLEQAVKVLDDVGNDPTDLIKYREKKDYKPLCAAASNALYISPYGDVFPCVLLRKQCGSVLERSIKDIWQSAELEQIRSISFDQLEDCQGCEIKNYCNRCPGIAFLESGSELKASKHDCFLAQARKDQHEMIQKAG